MAWGSEEPKGWHGYSKMSKQGLRGQARWSHSSVMASSTAIGPWLCAPKTALTTVHLCLLAVDTSRAATLQLFPGVLGNSFLGPSPQKSQYFSFFCTMADLHKYACHLHNTAYNPLFSAKIYLFVFYEYECLSACISVHCAYMVSLEARRGYQIPSNWSLQRVVSLLGMLGSEPGFSARAEPSHLSSLLLLFFILFSKTGSYKVQAVLLSAGITVGCHHAQSPCVLQTVFMLLEHLSNTSHCKITGE